MKILAILAALFLSIGYGHAQTYEKFVENSFDFLDKNDLVSAEEIYEPPCALNWQSQFLCSHESRDDAA